MMHFWRIMNNSCLVNLMMLIDVLKCVKFSGKVLCSKMIVTSIFRKGVLGYELLKHLKFASTNFCGFKLTALIA